MTMEQHLHPQCPIIFHLTHLCLVSHIYKRDIVKQCRLRSDATECSIWPGSTLFSLNTGLSIKYSNNKKKKKKKQKSLILEKDLPKELR